MCIRVTENLLCKILMVYRSGVEDLSLSLRYLLLLVINILMTHLMCGLRSASLFTFILRFFHWDVMHFNLLSIANSADYRPLTITANIRNISPILLQKLGTILRETNWLLGLLSYPHSIILWSLFGTTQRHFTFGNDVWRLCSVICKNYSLRNVSRNFRTLITIHSLI